MDGLGGTTASFGWLVILLIFIVVLGALFGWGRRDGFGGGGEGHCGGFLRGFNGGAIECGPSNWQIEKEGMLEACKTREAVYASSEKVMANENRHFDMAQAEKYNALTDKINRLETEKYIDYKLDQTSGVIGCKIDRLNAEVSEIECKMLKRPEIFGIGANCCGDIYPPIRHCGERQP